MTNGPSPNPSGSHDDTTAQVPEPRWRGDHLAWKRSILSWGAPPGDPRPVSAKALAIATAVFHAAADYNTLFTAPLEFQIREWGRVFDCSPFVGCHCWLSVELAVAGVHAHFAASTDGRMLPAHVLRDAGLLRLEWEANHGA